MTDERFHDDVGIGLDVVQMDNVAEGQGQPSNEVQMDNVVEGQGQPSNEVQMDNVVGQSQPSNEVQMDNVAEGQVQPSEPAFGMKFSSYEDARNFYEKYADRLGFGIKVQNSVYDHDRNVLRVCLACVKQGKGPKNPHDIFYATKLSSKSDCKARMRLRSQDGEYIVVEFISEHNHPLLKKEMLRFLPSKKKLSLAKKIMNENKKRTGIGATKTMLSLIEEAGGHENVPFTEQEIKNILEKSVILRLGHGDAEAMHNYFLHMQSKSPNFFYMLDLDPLGRLQNVFWADARSRAAYKYFGDVISFDTTYLINKYNIPFAPFVGVNHHGQSVLLGCGLVSSESKRSFKWLFRTWLSCMGGETPKAIVTDHSHDIINAVRKVFPLARHRLCLWHIMKKLPSKMGNLETSRKAVQNVVYDSLTPEEFEMRWQNLIEKDGLQHIDWSASMYELRHMWVPAFIKDHFWAGKSTIKQGESMNAFFDGYINSKTSLKQFFEQYEMALQSKYEKEAQADFDSFHKRRHMRTNFLMEEQLGEVYTIDMFKKCQEEFVSMCYCDLSLMNNEGSTYIFEVQEQVRLWENDEVDEPLEKVPTFINKIYQVKFDEIKQDVHCMCRSFDYRGILCRHAMCVLRNRGIKEVPPQYILNRWRKDVHRVYERCKHAVVERSDDPMQRYDDVHRRFVEFAEIAVISPEKYKEVLKVIEAGLQELEHKKAVEPEILKSQASNGVPENIQNISNPIQVSTVGCLPRNRKVPISGKIRKQYKRKGDQQEVTRKGARREPSQPSANCNEQSHSGFQQVLQTAWENQVISGVQHVPLRAGLQDQPFSTFQYFPPHSG